jgi:hypothetical protein
MSIDSEPRAQLRFLHRQVQDQLQLLNEQQCELEERSQHLCAQETLLLDQKQQFDRLQKEALSAHEKKEACLEVQRKEQEKAEKSLVRHLLKKPMHKFKYPLHGNGIVTTRDELSCLCDSRTPCLACRHSDSEGV